MLLTASSVITAIWKSNVQQRYNVSHVRYLKSSSSHVKMLLKSKMNFDNIFYETRIPQTLPFLHEINIKHY